VLAVDVLYTEVSGGGGVSHLALKQPVYMPALQCCYSALVRLLAASMVESFHKGVVVSRDGDRRRREAPFVVPCASGSGISGAVWPACERRQVATNWFAQQRRFFIIRGIGLSYSMQRLRLLYPLILSILFSAVLVLAVMIFQYWMILLALAVIWSVLIVFMTRLLCDKIYFIAQVKLDRNAHSSQQRPRLLSASPQFPVTPMPATPLIRVLETIDLSRMDIEQFIEGEGKLQTSTQVSIVRKEQTHSTNMSPHYQDDT
jgi:hypothetical protein